MCVHVCVWMYIEGREERVQTKRSIQSGENMLKATLENLVTIGLAKYFNKGRRI